MDSVIKRMKRPTPKFFKNLRNGALTLAAAGTAIVTAPVAVPAILVKIAGYFIVAGAVAGAVSQATVRNDK